MTDQEIEAAALVLYRLACTKLGEPPPSMALGRQYSHLYAGMAREVLEAAERARLAFGTNGDAAVTRPERCGGDNG